MARVTTTGGWSHASDADYRAWVAEIEQLLDDCGLVRTADTGQIDTSTATRPAANTTGGYSVWRFDDSLQSTAPVFIKVVYGTGGNTTSARFGVSIGTGSDGSGNLSNATSSTVNTSGGTIGAGTYTSYAIHREGFAALAYKVGGGASSSVSTPAFLVQRTVDPATGNPTDEGVMLIGPPVNHQNNSYGQCVRLRFQPTLESSGLISSQWLGIIPGNVSDGRVGLSPQVFPHWTCHPKLLPLMFSGGSVRGEIAVGVIYSMTLVGPSALDYLNVGATFGNTLTSPANTDTSILWVD